jgi:hypothetical protein
MSRKNTQTSFVSSLGRHNLDSLGKDIVNKTQTT